MCRSPCKLCKTCATVRRRRRISHLEVSARTARFKNQSFCVVSLHRRQVRFESWTELEFEKESGWGLDWGLG